MLNLNQKGSAGKSGLVLISLASLLVLSLVFGSWAYSKMQNYKNHSDKMIAVAVTAAETKATDVQSQKDAEAAKSPLATYNGPSKFGSIVIQYPKTWSAYVETAGNDQAPIDGFFYPGVIPSITDPNSYFALRIQVQDQTYDQVASGFGSGQQVTTSIKAYSLPKVPNVVGIMVTGSVSSDSNAPKTGTMVILPLRDKTLEIWTEGSQYLQDFNTYILPNISFSP